MSSKSVKKSWKTRKQRYGKDGRISDRKEWLSFLKKAVTKKKRSKLAREKLKQTAKPSKTRTKQLDIIRRAVRYRPRKLGYYKGDQIKPLSFSQAGIRQWKRAVAMDKVRTGKGYEEWEKLRTPKGKDRIISEWRWLDRRAKRKIGKVM